MDTAGSPTGPPPRYGAPVASEALVAVLAAAALGAVLWWLAEVGRRILDWRRLADWEAAWAAVGPAVDLALPVVRPALTTRHAATGARRGLAA
jgi:hypothetical protein